MPPDALAGAERVLVVRPDNLGDVVLTAPLFRALHEHLPNAELTLLASPGGALAAPLVPWIDRLETVRAVWQDLGGRLPFDPGGELELIARLHGGRYDAAIICTSFSQTPFAPGYAAYLAGIPVRVGQAPDFGGSVLSHAVEPAADGAHQAERNLHLLEAVGVPVRDRAVRLRVPPAAERAMERLLEEAGIGDGPIVVAPGASCAARRYDPVRYGIAARELARRTSRDVVVVGAERERAMADAVTDACPSAVSFAGRTSFPEVAAVISRAGLVLCGNSATLHLADAFERPVVALYSGTDRESEWGPRLAPARLLRIETFCAPCRRFDCPYAMACLAIEPELVVEAGLELLAAAPSTHAAVPAEEDRWVASAS
jgi:ADP-heptose:LPS heptosyltransferase